MNIEHEELAAYLKRYRVTFDDCEAALGSSDAAPYVGAIREKYEFNPYYPNNAFEVLVKDRPALDRDRDGGDSRGAWVSAWIWVPDNEAVKYRLTHESESL